jgi:hypothetical protein
MPLELWTTIASVGTFVVIAATAIAALVQLRHMRGSNQIAALTEFRESYESAHFGAARHFVADLLKKLDDPNVRTGLMARPLPAEYESVTVVGNLFESLGTFVKYGVIDANIACDIWGGPIPQLWHQMLPITTIMRRTRTNALWENWEYLTVLTEDFIARHAGSAYPRGVRHMPASDPRLEQDKTAGIIPPSS